MRVRDLKIGDTFHIGGNRKYINEDPTPAPYVNMNDNDIWVRCVLTNVPYVVDLDVEVDNINGENDER